MLTTIKGLPTGYNKDLQEDKEAVFGAEDTLAGCLAVVRSVVGGLTLDRERAAAAASGLLLATDVADYLVGRGVPFRRAHEIVGALVRRLVAERRDFESLSLAEWRAVERSVRGGHRRADYAGGLGGGEAHAAVDGAGRRGRPRSPRSGAGWTARAGSAKIVAPFAFHFPASGILGSVDAAAPASAW